MDEARESRPKPAGSRIPGLGLLWIALAAGYLAASASGHRALALGVVGLMVGALVAATGRLVVGLAAGLALAGACLRKKSSCRDSAARAKQNRILWRAKSR